MWEKGHSGNPNGARRPKRWQDALDRALEQYEKGEVKAGQALRAIADKVVSLALEGNKDAYQEIANRLDGKPEQVITGPDGDSIFAPLLIQSEAIRARLRLVQGDAKLDDKTGKAIAPEAA